jgi:hypothetical protein
MGVLDKLPRLTRDKLEILRGGGAAQVQAGRCCEGEGASAYWPWVQAIRL